MTHASYNSTITLIKNLTKDLALCRVKPDVPHKGFHPGQYVAIGLVSSASRIDWAEEEIEVPAAEKIIKRAYSIASAGHEEEFEFYIALLSTGTLTSRLAALKEGDRLWTATKVTGHFTLEGVPEDARLIFVATGTGLAPFISMVRSGAVGKRQVVILHGVRFIQDLGYREDVSRWVSKNPDQFHYFPFVSRDEPQDEVSKGYVQSAFQNGSINLDISKDHVFVCGNPAMIDDVEKVCVAAGMKEWDRKLGAGENRGLHLERYW